MTTVDEHKISVEQLRTAELKLEDDLTAEKIDLVAVRQREADSMHSTAMGTKPSKSAEAASMIVETIGAIERAIDSARAQRAEAIKAVWQAESAQQRQQAAKIAAEAEKHAAKTAELLAQLQAHEGVIFVPATTADIHGGRYLAVIPRSEMMRNEAAGIEQQAAALDGRAVVASGHVTASSRDELVETIRTWDAMRIGPTLHELAIWLADAERPVMATIARLSDEHQERVALSYAVTWRDGEIVAKDSKIEAVVIRPVALRGMGRMGEERVPIGKLVNPVWAA